MDSLDRVLEKKFDNHRLKLKLAKIIKEISDTNDKHQMVVGAEYFIHVLVELLELHGSGEE